MTALGFGLAGQAFGIWAGARRRRRRGLAAAACAADTWRRAAPVRAGTALVGDRHQHRQAEAGAEGRGPGRACAEGCRQAGAGRQARGQDRTRAEDRRQARAGRQARREGRAHAESGRQGKAGEKSVAKAEPAKQATAKAKPAGKVVAKTAPAKAIEAASTKPVAAKPAAKIAATGLMPEDFHKPQRDRAAGSARRSQGDLGRRPEARKGAERSRRLDLCAGRRLE